MTLGNARTARLTGGNCAPNGGEMRAKRGENARLTGCRSLGKIGALQPLQSLHPLGGRDGGNAHARGLAFAAARCAGGARYASRSGRGPNGPNRLTESCGEICGTPDAPRAPRRMYAKRKSENARRTYTEPQQSAAPRGPVTPERDPTPTPAGLVFVPCPDSGQPFAPRAV